ncbi:MAG: carboxylesterase, partial [Rhodanobacteraceae bacterium]
MTLESVEIATGTDPRHAVIWLHGLGADGHDFEPIVPQLVRPDWPALRFVFPHAPVRPITLNGGLLMRAWYDIAGFELSQRQDQAGIR